MGDPDVLAREQELEAEIVRLHDALAQARGDARRLHDDRRDSDDRHRADLVASRAETSAADRRFDAARAAAQGVASDHRRDLAGATADLAASQDLVDELRASQAALASSEARQRAIFDSAGDVAMVITDPAGIVTDWNPGA